MCRGNPLTIRQQFGLLARHAKKQNRKKDLPDSVEISVGMQVIVTTNVETELDIVNGSRAEVIQIVLDPRELLFEVNQTIVNLQYLPLAILVKMDHT